MDLCVIIEGVGLWAPGVPHWPAAVALLRGVGEFDASATRPVPVALPPAERRRAPDTVQLAVQVAAEACDAAGRNPAMLACVFASSQGDLAITDTMCTTLANAPLELSPTKFHNSVHNAAVGYWTIVTGCHRASTALSAARHSVGAGLFEAAVQVVESNEPVLLVCYDSVAAAGPLAEVAPHAAGFAVAFVLAPARAGMPQLRVGVADVNATVDCPRPSEFAARMAGNPASAALPMLHLLANTSVGRVRIAASPVFWLDVEVTP